VDLPANRAKLWFVLEADRMRNPIFREFYAEREVIAEERRQRTETSPGGLLYEAHLATAFQVHPYGVQPIGHMDDIRNLSRTQVEAFYRRYYGPGNTVVAMVGDFDADSARVWAEQYFGPLRPTAPPPPVLAREPEQRGERRVEILFDAEPQIRMAWKVPDAFHPDAAALTMLANVLVAGRDSRLYRRLVRDDRIAASVGAGTGPATRYPGLFTIQATPRAPHTVAELEEVIAEELDRLRREPPTEEEVERVRTRLEADQVRRLVSSQGLAFQLASSEATWGDWRETFILQQRLSAVTPEDIVAALERYLLPETRTVAVLRRPAPAP
jgi:predicted Zn-dependent peptidase